MKRLFFALWPDDNTRCQCFDVARRLKQYGRPVQAGNLHLTLLFLGATTGDQEKALREAAANIVFRPMQLTFDRLSHWRKPGVCCLTSSASDDAMLELVKQLRQIVATQQMPLETRAFQAHVTLLRKCTTVPQALISQPIHWRSQAFCLVESRSSLSGIQYQIIQQWSFD